MPIFDNITTFVFSFGETSALHNEIRDLDDFELICFLVVKKSPQNAQNAQNDKNKKREEE